MMKLRSYTTDGCNKAPANGNRCPGEYAQGNGNDGRCESGGNDGDKPIYR